MKLNKIFYFSIFISTLLFILSIYNIENNIYYFKSENGDKIHKLNWSYSFKNYGCNQFLLNISENCSANTSSIPNTIIVGDSHSQGLYLILSEQKYNLSLARIGNILPLKGIESFYYKSEADSLITKLEGIKNIDTIILSFRGVTWLSNKDQFSSVKQSQYNINYLNGIDVNNSNINKFIYGLDKTFLDLSTAKKNVIFIIDNPELDFEPEDCEYIYKKSLVNKKIQSPCSVDYKKYLSRAHEYRKFVISIASKYKNVYLLDSASLFCTESECSAKQNNIHLYQDNNHLNIFGSKVLADEIISLIRKIKINENIYQ